MTSSTLKGSKAHPSRDLLEVIEGGAQVAAAMLTAPVLRGWYDRWGATPAEAAAVMPGDELVPNPVDNGRGTRLVARELYSYPRRQSVLWHVIEAASFVMERWMLHGLRTRAEDRRAAAPGACG